MSTSTSRIMFNTIPCDISFCSPQPQPWRAYQAAIRNYIVWSATRQLNTIQQCFVLPVLWWLVWWVFLSSLDSVRWYAKVLIDLNYSSAGEGTSTEKARAWNSDVPRHTTPNIS